MIASGSRYDCKRLHLGSLALIALAFSAKSTLADDADYINADRPGIADGSNVVGPKRFEIETGLQREYRRNGEDRSTTTFVPTLFRFGIDDHWEVRIESNVYSWVRSSSPINGVSHDEGYSPASIGLKYHFLDTQGIKQPSLGAIIRLFPPSGTGSFHTRHVTGDFRIAADWDFAAKFSLNPNVGLATYEDGNGDAYAAGLFAATLNYNPSKVLNFFVDTGLQTPEQKNGRTAITYDAGVAYLPTHNVQLDLSIGTGASGLTPPRSFVSVGISKRF